MCSSDLNLILYVLILFCNYNWAQQNQTFNIISQFEPNVKNGNKLSSSPELPDTSVQETSLSLGILPNPSQFVINPEPIAAATLKPKPERLRPKALISVGLAPIYLMPIISAHYASQPNRNGMWGLSVSHVSADYKTDNTLLNNFSNTECAAYGIQHIKLLTLQPDFVYRRNINYFFNTSTNFAFQVPEMDRESSIWQQMQTLAPSLALQSHYTDSTKINFNALISNGAIIIDVRSPQEFDRGHIEGSKNIPVNLIQRDLEMIKKWNKPIITVCQSGARSNMAKSILKSAGIEVSSSV